MKCLRNKKCLYYRESIKGIKITVHAVIELACEVFGYGLQFHMCWLKDLVKIH